MIKQDSLNISSLSILDINVFFLLCWPAAWCSPERGEQDVLDICHPPSQRAASDGKTLVLRTLIYIFFSFEKVKYILKLPQTEILRGIARQGGGIWNIRYSTWSHNTWRGFPEHCKAGRAGELYCWRHLGVSEPVIRNNNSGLCFVILRTLPHLS